MLLNLPKELLNTILNYVALNDIENFLLSCKRLHQIANLPFLQQHSEARKRFKRIQICHGLFGSSQSPKLLESFLLAPKMADYVKEMEVYDWMVSWDRKKREEKFFLVHLPFSGTFHTPVQ